MVLHKLALAHLLLLLTLPIFVAPAHGQDATSPVATPHDTFTLQGTVVSSVEGTPIHAALVQISGEKSWAALTGPDGTFKFEGLPTSDFLISARKPGFFSPVDVWPESQGDHRVHVGGESQPLELQLIPEGVIYGRVLGERGEPVEGLQVQLRPLSAKRSQEISAQNPAVTTNEIGEYRLAEIKPGSYYVIVTPGSQEAPAGRSTLVSGRQQGYQTYFYPGVTDAAAATPLRISPGKQLSADVRVAKRSYFHVSGHVATPGTGAVAVALVNGQDQSPIATVNTNPATQDFRFEGVPSGNYYLLAALLEAGDKNAGARFGKMPLLVNGDVDDVSIAIAEPVTVPVTIRLESENESSQAGPNGLPPVSISFVDVSLSFGGGGRVDLTPANGFQGDPNFVAPLLPGTYWMQISPFGNTYVAEANSGGTDLLKENLTVAAGAAADPIEIVLRDDAANIQGTVSRNGKPAQGRVLLIPERAPRRFVSTPVDSDGNFRALLLAPGSYSVIAIEDSEEFDGNNAEMLEQLQRRATTVDLGPNSSPSVQLELKRLEE